MDFKTLKGTRDIEPQEQIIINKILSVIQKNFERYGFRPFTSTTIEFMETLTFKYSEDAEIVQEIFRVTDRGKRDLGLRYDLTTGLCRYVASKKQLKLPFRRYEIGKVFRDGPIKKGRSREFIQCDADVVGVKGVEIEAELLKMFYETYLELGIKEVVIEINNNKILRGTFLQAGLKEETLSEVILCVDKLKKIGKDGVLKEIQEKGIDVKKAENGIDLLSSGTFKEIKEKAVNELLKDGISELERLIELLELLKIKYRINFSLARGLDIYTGNIWEAYVEGYSSSIGAGGRYDKIIGEFKGEDTEIPAVGVSFGLVPIYEIVKEKIGKNDLVDILVIPISQEVIKEALYIADELRKKSNVEVFYTYKLKKGLEYADYRGIRKVAIIGPRETKEGYYIIRDMKTKEQEKVKIGA